MTSRAVSPVFAGREAELTALARAFEDAGDGVPGTVLVGAEAGGGKSRLVGEFAARLDGRALVLAGGCVELAGAGLPYAPFTAALRGLVRERGPAGVTGLLGGRDAGELARLLPEFGAPPAGADALMFVKGIGWHFGGRCSGVAGWCSGRLLLACGQDRDGPLQVERASSY